MRVFEWGAGSSTLFFARRVAEVTSVEHDATWYATIKQHLARHRITNVCLTLVSPSPLARDPPPYGTASYTSARPDAGGLDFRDYVEQIDDQPDAFDVILVDGRARASCLAHACNKLISGGILILDNAERPLYEPAFALLDGLRCIRLDGPGPSRPRPWTTAIWVAE